MSARLVLLDALLMAGAVVPDLGLSVEEWRTQIPSLPLPLWRAQVVPLLRAHHDDPLVAKVASATHATELRVARLCTSERQARFHDAVLRTLAAGEHPSGGRIQEQLRGHRTATEGLDGKETKWRTELLLALGWTPPPSGEYGRWLPPGETRKVKHRWCWEAVGRFVVGEATIEHVLVCRHCRRARWMTPGSSGRYTYAPSVEAVALTSTWSRKPTPCQPAGSAA